MSASVQTSTTVDLCLNQRKCACASLEAIWMAFPEDEVEEAVNFEVVADQALDCIDTITRNEGANDEVEALIDRLIAATHSFTTDIMWQGNSSGACCQTTCYPIKDAQDASISHSFQGKSKDNPKRQAVQKVDNDNTDDSELLVKNLCLCAKVPQKAAAAKGPAKTNASRVKSQKAAGKVKCVQSPTVVIDKDDNNTDFELSAKKAHKVHSELPVSHPEGVSTPLELVQLVPVAALPMPAEVVCEWVAQRGIRSTDIPPYVCKLEVKQEPGVLPPTGSTSTMAVSKS
ncbi:hypothetical protein ONZ51_g9622 [Trametes cubensis]|uniref:Uncharacterized protein n=1 Tax=Trametes cubensis TaxID=1111947 RepID=A0AAD7X5H5_9APHY|nr:hypothetical protein ONZ51_g9622 [Trametes cubensis]